MHLWERTDWRKFYSEENVRRGLRVRYAPDMDAEVKETIKKFVLWLRRNYYFPFRVVIYVKATNWIIALDGEEVNGTFFEPFDRYAEPYIRVATGYFAQKRSKWGRDDALAAILRTIAHELSHYYQWINDVKLTERGYEWQASMYAHRIVYEEYAQCTDHP